MTMISRNDVLDAIKASPGVSSFALAQRFALNIDTIATHTRNLRKAGLIRTDSPYLLKDKAWHAVDPAEVPQASLELCMWSDGTLNMLRGQESILTLGPTECRQVYEFFTRCAPPAPEADE